MLGPVVAVEYYVVTNKPIAPVAMKFEGNQLGYRSVNVPGGILIKGCVDNAPISLADNRGRHVGLMCYFCTKPNEKDTVVVMFTTAEKLARSNVSKIRVGCSSCPKEGLVIKADLATILAK